MTYGIVSYFFKKIQFIEVGFLGVTIGIIRGSSGAYLGGCKGDTLKTPK